MRVVILTGAGISAESGVATFRDSGGLWEGHDIEDVATPAGFARSPELVQTFYDARRAHTQTVEPNAAHFALARLEQELNGTLTLITQNVDDLHERAGSKNVLHMHGELLSAWCTNCDGRTPWHGQLLNQPACPSCGVAELRPDIVWFGEMPYYLDQIHQAVESCDVFVAIGTSGEVYPAAGYVAMAAAHGAHTIEFNLATSTVSSHFQDVHPGPATLTVPRWVESLL